MLCTRGDHCRLSATGWLPCMLAYAALGIWSLTWADTPANTGPEPAAKITRSIEKTPVGQPIETVRERHSDGHIKIEREVTLDAGGNYVNHGAWRMWDPAGKLIAEGRYDMGQRVGLWKRTHVRDDSPLLNEIPFSKFTAPFTSQATFVAGELNGEWVICDAVGRKCSRVALVCGKRHGEATLWLPDDQVYRETSFQHGLANGILLQRDAAGQLSTAANYVDGHLLVNKVTNFPESEIKQSEGFYLTALNVAISTDDFWDLRFAEYEARVENQRHGTFKMWHANGQLKLEGNFRFDRESGRFTWWHANGQQAVEGEFIDGQQNGRWEWWFANGQKASQGEYHIGTLVNTWQQWNSEGRLVQRKDFQKQTIAKRSKAVMADGEGR